MSEQDAFAIAEPYLKDNWIVRVVGNQIRYYECHPESRPRAQKNTYLVRVNSDDSLYVVHRALS